MYLQKGQGQDMLICKTHHSKPSIILFACRGPAINSSAQDASAHLELTQTAC